MTSLKKIFYQLTYGLHLHFYLHNELDEHTNQPSSCPWCRVQEGYEP